MGSKAKILTTGLREHPAVRAWQKLDTSHAEPDHLVVYKKRQAGAVFGLAGAHVVAKRCMPDKGRLERLVYEHVLPRVGPAPVRYYGSVDDGAWIWLFLEDIGDQRYDPDVASHRRLAAEWFGKLEAAVERDELTRQLPDRGPNFYRACLQSILDALPELLGRSALQGPEGEILSRIAAGCGEIAAVWTQIETFCESVPTAFAHGDCLPKNVHVRSTADGPRLAPFDWGGTGWSPAGTDLGQLALPHRGPPVDGPDYVAYRDCVRARWPELDLDTIRRLASLGQLFWALKVISRSLPEFDCDWRRPEHLLADLAVYERALARSLGVADGRAASAVLPG